MPTCGAVSSRPRSMTGTRSFGSDLRFLGRQRYTCGYARAHREYCRETAPAAVLDWQIDFGFDAVSSHYSALNVPGLLVRGALANPAMLAITDALRQALPDAPPCAHRGSRPFLITSYASQCAGLLEASRRRSADRPHDLYVPGQFE
jgi:hypothetical protein